jgi:hypothetical protein
MRFYLLELGWCFHGLESRWKAEIMKVNSLESTMNLLLCSLKRNTFQWYLTRRQILAQYLNFQL